MPELVGCEYAPVHVCPPGFEAHVFPDVHEDDCADWQCSEFDRAADRLVWGLWVLFVVWGYVDHVVLLLCCADVEEADLPPRQLAASNLVPCFLVGPDYSVDVHPPSIAG